MPDCQGPDVRKPGCAGASWSGPEPLWGPALQRLTVLRWHRALHPGSSYESHPALGSAWKDVRVFRHHTPLTVLHFLSFAFVSYYTFRWPVISWMSHTIFPFLFVITPLSLSFSLSFPCHFSPFMNIIQSVSVFILAATADASFWLSGWPSFSK